MGGRKLIAPLCLHPPFLEWKTHRIPPKVTETTYRNMPPALFCVFVFPCRLWELGPQHSAWTGVLCILCLVWSAPELGISQSARERAQRSSDQFGKMGPQASPRPGTVALLSLLCFQWCFSCILLGQAENALNSTSACGCRILSSPL